MNDKNNNGALKRNLSDYFTTDNIRLLNCTIYLYNYKSTRHKYIANKIYYNFNKPIYAMI